MAHTTKTVSKKVTNVKDGGVVKPKVAKKKKTAVKVAKTVEAVVVAKPKVGTNSEEKFICPTVGCNRQLPRYQDMFTHFMDVCRPSDADKLGWWCDLCQIPRYWKDGSHLICHKQVMHPKEFEFPSALCEV